MSTQCRHFVQNAWKKELCSNCFKSREEHAANQESHRQIVTRTANSVKRVAHKVQGILRLKEASPPNQVRSKRKNVAFPESLTEIIGYDGGDDLGSDYEYDDPNQPDDPDSGCGDDDGLDVSLGSDVDDLPDSEEERALGNLTRANTNFNTVTANLTGAVQPNDVKTFASLMLGRAPKDGDTKKKPLLVTVTPFGGDDSVPTARRPSDKKAPEQTKPKPAAEPTPKPVPEPVMKKPLDEPKPCEQPPTTKTTPNNNNNSNLGKIVDMPLITSTNLLSVIETKSTNSSEQKQRATSIARTPAIKKPENEKPRIAVAQQNVDQNTARNHKNLEMSNGVELNLSPIRAGEEIVRETTTFGKEIPSYKSTDYPRKTTGIADLTERKVEGEAATDKYPFEESRESAGEPDGKADEEVIAEPPALPKSPPPIESNSSTFALEKQQQQRHSTLAEPRTSFLHGITETKSIGKPVIPQKPVTLPTKAVGASLASLLSENRAYEFRLSQAARNNNLVHSQSETQLCEEVVTKRNVGQESQSGKAVAESCSELFKASVAKVGDKDDTTEEDDDEDDSEASSTDQPRSNTNKRRMAPQPPASTILPEDSSSTMFTRNPAPTPVKSDCPVVREKEKRERASSCSPKFRKSGVCDAPDPSHQVVIGRPPEPAPRRNISLSQDSLAMAAGAERIVEEKKKTRSKFSLKKFLRMGTRKDVDMTGGSSGSRNDEIPSTPQPKPRLEIIHPLELDGAAVQVLRNDKTSGEDTTDSKSEPQGNTNSQPVHGAQHVTTRPSKPPPPPRSQSLDESSRPTSRASVPKQPQQPSPTSSSNGKPLTGKSWQPSGGSGSSASDSIYANLVAAAAAASAHAAAEDVAGAIRSGLAPAKPRRTSSMRDQANNNNNNVTGTSATGTPGVVPTGNRIGAVSNGVGLQRHPGVERQRPVIADLQERLAKASNDRRSCSPDLNDSSASLELRQGTGGYGGTNHPITKRQSDSGALESNSNEMKFQQSLFTRSTSLPYCASEAESEMYSPFGYYYGDESTEDSQDRKKDEETRIGRLRQRRGRSIVHRSLEDNYGAVIVANHEALAQFLEQTNQPLPIPAGLRSLKTASNLQFNDFSIDRSSAVSTGRRIFFSAVWNEQNVTLCVAFDPSMHASRKEFYLVPIVEFIDAVPKDVSDLGQLNGKKSSEATISVLPRLQVNTLKSFAELISSSESGGKDENSIRESSFILLQLVSALKSLQARGVEEAPGNLANVVLCREDKDAYHRLYMFQGLNIENCENNEEQYASLCQCAQNGLEELNLVEKLPLIQELLMREKAVTLSQVKSVLEFSLWGPSDATLGGPREREQALQRWLDLERATVLHALVRARAQLTVTDEYQLLFLVRTSAKIMCEASLLLDRQRNGLIVRSN